MRQYNSYLIRSAFRMDNVLNQSKCIDLFYMRWELDNIRGEIIQVGFRGVIWDDV